MSIAVPPIPADPWCSRTFECGMADRLPVVPEREQELACAVSHPEVHGAYVVGDGAHTVADRQHPRHRAAGRVDEQSDVGARVLGGEQEKGVAQPVAVAVLEGFAEQDGPALIEAPVELVVQSLPGIVVHVSTLGHRRHEEEERAAQSSAAGSSAGDPPRRPASRWAPNTPAARVSRRAP